jgi:CheY-like chemotaxis protein
MQGPNGRVLLAEDDPALQAVLSRWLNAAGYVVDTHATGAGLLRALEPTVEAVILDWALADTDSGFVLGSMARYPEAFAVLAISSTPGAEVPREALAQGAIAFQHKPLEREDFLRGVAASLRVSHFARAILLEAARAATRTTADGLVVVSAEPGSLGGELGLARLGGSRVRCRWIDLAWDEPPGERGPSDCVTVITGLDALGSDAALALLTTLRRAEQERWPWCVVERPSASRHPALAVFLAERAETLGGLRARPGDVERLLARAEDLGVVFAPDARAVIAAHAWPGNERELALRVARAHVAARGRAVDLPLLDLDATDPHYRVLCA